MFFTISTAGNIHIMPLFTGNIWNSFEHGPIGIIPAAGESRLTLCTTATPLSSIPQRRTQRSKLFHALS